MHPEQSGAMPDARHSLPAHDYVSPGLAVVMPDHAFPNMIPGDTSVPRWPWLRRWVEQTWYCDRRNPDAGFASRDEASILFNNALKFRGKPCLEVGCWRGWSAVHIALAADNLTIIDPILGDPGFAESIRASCEAAGVLDRVSLHEGYSPGAIDTLSQATRTRWAFMFIDAEHEGDAPRQDAEAAMRNAADTAMVLFHDLASPYVAAGLDAMRNAGWRTMVYQTMQIMGVAWRGAVEPVQHIPDPSVFWTLPRHLAGYSVSGWTAPTLDPDGGWWPGMTMQDRRDAAMMRAQAAEDARTVELAARERAEVAAEQARAAGQHAQAQIEGVQGERIALQAEWTSVSAERTRLLLLHEEAQRQVSALQAEHAKAVERAITAEVKHDQALRRAQAAEVSVAELVAVCRRQSAELQDRAATRDRTLADHAVAERENAGLVELSRWIVQKRVLIGLLRRSPVERLAAVERQAAGFGLGEALARMAADRLCRRRVLAGLLRRPASYAQALVSAELLLAAQVWRQPAA